MQMDGKKTFILVLSALGLTFLGVYLNMFDPSVFTSSLYAAFGAVGLREFADKIKIGGKK